MLDTRLRDFSTFVDIRSKSSLDLLIYRMKKIVLICHKLLALIFFAFLFGAQAQPSNKMQTELINLKEVLDKNHFSPQIADDRLSGLVFSRFIYLLDPHSLYFTDKDIIALSKFKEKIDNEIKGESWSFLPTATTLYKQRLSDAEKTFNEILNKPLDFSIKESISLSHSDTADFSKYNTDYQQRWKKWLKHQTLRQLLNASLADSIPKPDKEILAKEPEIREKVKKIERRNILRILEDPQGFENYVASLFFNSITYCFDPHTLYLSKTDWENFHSSISKENYSFGIDLKENEIGDIVISRLFPGGPAWKSNELHKGDLLIELKWAGKKAVDITDAQLDEIESILESSNAGKLELTIRKINGQIKTITLSKEKLRTDENVVKSFVLKGTKTIGYISLPGFYTEWENMSGMGCANDVAKEIVKLKKEKIEGLILDIRYNGGGSLMEGANLAGIFVDEGPLFLIKERDGKPVVMKDMNRGTIYDGPLVLMINGQSASASEVLASTLRDYNRALIVGSSTFGKATGQVILPISGPLNSPGARISVTVEKLYRVTGKSFQQKGIHPDILLPDIYEKLNIKESAYLTALPSDSVIKQVYYTPLKPMLFHDLSLKSADRVSKQKNFQLLKKLTDSYGRIKDEMNMISLNYATYKSQTKEIFRWFESMNDTEEKPTSLFKVQNILSDEELLKLDSYNKEINTFLIENLQSDIYLEETFQIASDLIHQTKNQ